jgi:hypothetical protein
LATGYNSQDVVDASIEFIERENPEILESGKVATQKADGCWVLSYTNLGKELSARLKEAAGIDSPYEFNREWLRRHKKDLAP